MGVRGLELAYNKKIPTGSYAVPCNGDIGLCRVYTEVCRDVLGLKAYPRPSMQFLFEFVIFLRQGIVLCYPNKN